MKSYPPGRSPGTKLVEARSRSKLQTGSKLNPTRSDEAVVDEKELEVSAEELRDFLAADLVEVQASPHFKERLRGKLWRFVRENYGRGSSKP